MLDKKETLDRLGKLNDHLIGVNNSFQEKIQLEESDVCELVTCMCTYGENLRILRNYYEQNGYPIKTDRHGNESVATHYDVWMLDEQARNCSEELNKLRLAFKQFQPDFFGEEVVDDFLVELSYRVVTGEYNIPENAGVAMIKKEVMSKTMGILFSIFKSKQNNPNYQYEDDANFMKLQEAYQIYKDEVGTQIVLHDVIKDGEAPIKYVGPQFGNNVEAMFKVISNKYENTSTVKK